MVAFELAEAGRGHVIVGLFAFADLPGLMLEAGLENEIIGIDEILRPQRWTGRRSPWR